MSNTNQKNIIIEERTTKKKIGELLNGLDDKIDHENIKRSNLISEIEQNMKSFRKPISKIKQKVNPFELNQSRLNGRNGLNGLNGRDGRTMPNGLDISSLIIYFILIVFLITMAFLTIGLILVYFLLK